MPLVSLRTNLKSLKFGMDRPGGGSSNQPFIQLPYFPYNINQGGDVLSNITTEQLGYTGGSDIFIRGGVQVGPSIAKDFQRLGKYFLTPDGLAFFTQQNLLSASGVRIYGGYPVSVRSVNAARLNDGVYTPLSTLAAAAGIAVGGHPDKQGFAFPGGRPEYEKLVTGETISGVTIPELSIKEQANNRLWYLYKNKIGSKSGSSDTELYSYLGGPGAGKDLGGLKTTIKTASARTAFSGLGNQGSIFWATFSQDQLSRIQSQQDAPIIDLVDLATNLTNTIRVGDGGSTIASDFRTHLIDENGENTKSIISRSTNYKVRNVDNRLNQGIPGARTADRSDYQRGRPDNDKGLDQINSLYLYRSEAVTTDKRKNDIVKFRIATIDNDNPAYKIFSHFRAYINSFNDSIYAKWNDFRYVGRGENFYTYQGFTNNISIGFTVVAQSIQELSVMYQKLNYLKSTMAPDYSPQGYMRGNIHQMTIGGYLYEVPGIINDLTYTIPNDTTWEIGIRSDNVDIEAEGGITFRDPKVKELPHRIDVVLTFIPIYRFLPERVKDINGGGNITQRFISLEDNLGSNNLYQTTPSNLFRPSDHQIVDKTAKTS